MRPTSTKPGERIDLPSLFQTTAEHYDEAFGWALAEFGILARQLRDAGQPQAAKVVENEGRAAVVFGELAARGVWMPSTSNGIERICGMIAHRCKRAWARWGSGLRNMVILLLVRKTRPSIYRSAIARYMRSVSGGGVCY